MKILHMLAVSAAFVYAAPVHAITPVIDGANLLQAIKQVEAWSQQYAQMQAQIRQLQAQQASMTGDRGMGGLLANQNRTYLPPDWNQAMNTLATPSTGYSMLASTVQQIQQAQSVLTPQEASRLSPQMQQYLTQARRLSASQQAMGQVAYTNAAHRFSLLQRLTDALNGQTDPKAVLDLQARIAAEQVQLQNDQTQLQSLTQLTAAQSQAQQGMANEIRTQTSGTGSFPRLR
jgi:type IV secretion system protein VirB5